MPEPADETYRRWAAGRCPCCAAPLEEHEDRDGEVTQPQVIGEGVTICGRCSAEGHMEDPDGLQEDLLMAIAMRSDAPLSAGLNRSRTQSL
jgi:hypothetical protein